jgi:hypothetical protein
MKGEILEDDFHRIIGKKTEMKSCFCEGLQKSAQILLQSFKGSLLLSTVGFEHSAKAEKEQLCLSSPVHLQQSPWRYLKCG